MADRRELVAVITADPKGLDAALANAGRRTRRGGQQIGRELAISVKRGFGSVTDLIGLGGVAGVLAAGKQVFDFQKRLVRLRQSSRESVGTMQRLEKQLFAVGRARGIDPTELLGGAEKYTELTGDLMGFVDQLDALGKVGTAGAGSLDELAAIAANASMSMGVASEDMAQMFDVLVSQGQRGSVELKEMARELPSLIAMHRNFGKTGVDAMAEMGAMIQMGKKGFGTGSEAATGYMALMGQITKKAAQLKKFKVNVFDAKGNKRAASDILHDLAASKLGRGGKMESQLIKVLGSKEAVLFFNAFKAEGQKVFQDLSDKQKALGTVDAAAKIWDDSPAKKMAAAQARMSEFFNENMKNHIEKIAVALDKVAAALEIVAKNWQLVVAAVLAGKGIDLLGDMASLGGGGGGGRRGKGGRSKGGGGASAWEKAKAAALSFGAGYAIGEWIDEKTDNKLSKGVSTGVGSAIDVVDPGFKERYRDVLGIGSDRTAAAQIEGRTNTTRLRRRVRDDVMARALEQEGMTPDMLTDDQRRELSLGVSERLRSSGAAVFPSVMERAGEQQMPELIAELRRLRETIQRDGGGRVTVQTDEGNRATHRRRGN